MGEVMSDQNWKKKNGERKITKLMRDFATFNQYYSCKKVLKKRTRIVRLGLQRTKKYTLIFRYLQEKSSWAKWLSQKLCISSCHVNLDAKSQNITVIKNLWKLKRTKIIRTDTNPRVIKEKLIKQAMRFCYLWRKINCIL